MESLTLPDRIKLLELHADSLKQIGEAARTALGAKYHLLILRPTGDPELKTVDTIEQAAAEVASLRGASQIKVYIYYGHRMPSSVRAILGSYGFKIQAVPIVPLCDGAKPDESGSLDEPIATLADLALEVAALEEVPTSAVQPTTPVIHDEFEGQDDEGDDSFEPQVIG